MKKIFLVLGLVLLASSGYAQNHLTKAQHDTIYLKIFNIKGVQWGPILKDQHGKNLQYANCISVKPHSHKTSTLCVRLKIKSPLINIPSCNQTLNLLL